jgi:hypothetical protein
VVLARFGVLLIPVHSAQWNNQKRQRDPWISTDPVDFTNVDEQFRIRNVEPQHPAMQVAMALIAENDGESRCVGTGFAVAPGLAVTAQHVIDGCATYQEKRDGYRRPGAQFSLHAIQLHEGKICQWSVEAIYGSTAADIAFLQLSRPAWWGDGPGQVKPRIARLNLNPPNIGDELRIFGFPNSKFEGVSLVVSPSECACRVRRVDRELSVLSPHWRIEVEGEIEPGMSGGPCFDANWDVVGVNSSEWRGDDILAYVAPLWPAMKLEIDLFKSGPFPAIDLFKQGPLRALGYRRVYVASEGTVHLSKADPAKLVPFERLGSTESLLAGLDFAVSNAQELLVELRAILGESASQAASLNVNRLHLCLRHYFWELESALRLALICAARQANVSVTEPPTWEQVLNQWRKQASDDPKTLDELTLLDFDWNSVDLFEVRTYALFSRSGTLEVETVVNNDGDIVGTMLNRCHTSGQQVPLPDGLDRYFQSSKRFVQKVLVLSNRRNLNQECQADLSQKIKFTKQYKPIRCGDRPDPVHEKRGYR